jgi:hypothetical protein
MGGLISFSTGKSLVVNGLGGVAQGTAACWTFVSSTGCATSPAVEVPPG